MTTRAPLRRDLSDIKQRVYLLWEKCIEISNIFNSLIENPNSKLENNLIEINKDIKKESKELNNQCFLVLTLQQPLIRDLRFVIGSLQIIFNLEKLADQYFTSLQVINNINILNIEILEKIINMSIKVIELLKTALTHYLAQSYEPNDHIKNKIAEINIIHDTLYKTILNEMANTQGIKTQTEAEFLSTIKMLEKNSDLVLNIIEQINYIIVGNTEN